MTLEEKAARIVHSQIPVEQRRAALERACSRVSAKVAIDFVRDVRGKR